MVDVVVRNAAREVVALVPSVDDDEAVTLASSWLASGAVAGALSVELCRQLFPGVVRVEAVSA